ncbi:MAG: helix-turn-helix transcriptional regulator [Deltaproteobacteria bacterium]|jgi:transcriptional regulator with XRE-family HTH domain|nr:helix-turn-helix transcriptional regulator [Deltaproteobacteria bacterium]
MTEINDIFLESLLFFLSKEKSQRSLALKLGVSPPYLNDLIMKRRNPEDRTKRKIAAALGYPDRFYEDFLSVGRCVLSGETVNLDVNRDSKDNYLRSRGVLAVKYSHSLLLDEDNKIEVTADESESPVVVFGPSIRRATAENLQSFTCIDKDMGDVAPKNSVIIVDLSLTSVEKGDGRQLMLLCTDKVSRVCTVKYIDWLNNLGKALVTAEDKHFKPICCDLKKLIIVGKVIMVTAFYN